MREPNHALQFVGVLLALTAVPIGMEGANMLAVLAFLDPPAGQSWEAMKRERTEDWFVALWFLPLLAIVTAIIAAPALLLLRHFGWSGWLAHGLAGAVMGLLLALAVTELGGSPGPRIPLWSTWAASGMGGALAYWTVRRLCTFTFWLLTAFPACFMRLTDEGPPGETWRQRLARANRGQG